MEERDSRATALARNRQPAWWQPRHMSGILSIRADILCLSDRQFNSSTKTGAQAQSRVS